LLLFEERGGFEEKFFKIQGIFSVVFYARTVLSFGEGEQNGYFSLILHLAKTVLFCSEKSANFAELQLGFRW